MSMFKRVIATIGVICAAAFSAPAARADHPQPRVQAAPLYFNELTRINGQFLRGLYIVVHDEGKMARGEPCTTFYQLKDKMQARAVVTFQCVPKVRAPVSKTTFRTCDAVGATTATPVVDLVDFQFA